MELQWDEERQELSYRMDQDVANLSIALKMIEHNQIAGLLPLHRQYIDEQIQLIYEVHGYHNLQGVLEKRPVSVAWACRMLQLILDVVLEGDSYFLDMQEYCLAPEFIYCNHGNQKVFLCYMPGNKRDPGKDFQVLMESIMEHMDHRNKQETEWFYGLYDMYCSDGITFAELREHLERCNWNKKLELQHPSDTPNDKKTVKNGIENSIEQLNEKKQKVFCLKRYEPHSFWKKKKRMASILPEEFILHGGEHAVGRRQDQSLQLLPQQISREHALLAVEQNHVYLTDQGSSNGTYVNERKISAHVKTCLEMGDVITFADISYQLCNC